MRSIADIQRSLVTLGCSVGKIGVAPPLRSVAGLSAVTRLIDAVLVACGLNLRVARRVRRCAHGCPEPVPAS